MTWTAEQEREYQAKRAQKRELDEAYGRLYDERERQVKRLSDLIYTCAQAVGSAGAGVHAIKNADALIAILQPFASAPEPEHVEDADGWIESTGVCPVEKGVRIDVRLMAGDDYHGLENAPAHGWGLSGGSSQITHWRLHKPQESKA